MKNLIRLFGITALTAAMVSAMIACDNSPDDNAPDGRTFDAAIPLSEGTWVNGNIPPGEVLWFRFTPALEWSNSLQILFDGGTLNDVNVQIFYNSDTAMPGRAEYNSYAPVIDYVGFNFLFEDILEIGRTYYVKVSPYSDSGYTYRIKYGLAILVTCL